MKKLVSIFMALVMVFTVVPNMFSRAEGACEGDTCLTNEEPLTVDEMCERNPENCTSYRLEAVWNSTASAVSETWKKAVENWNWCMGDKKMCFGYSADKLWNGTKFVGDKVGNRSAAAYTWLNNRGAEAAEFSNDLLTFHKEKDENKPTWPFWALVGAAFVNPVLALPLLVVCCCRR